MSEVRKYKALGDMVPRSRNGGGEFVRLEDFDAAKAELSALREELAKYEQRDADLVKAMTAADERLTAAEQRNAELAEVLEMVRFHVSMVGTQAECDRIDAALKPTKSGASE